MSILKSLPTAVSFFLLSFCLATKKVPGGRVRHEALQDRTKPLTSLPGLGRAQGFGEQVSEMRLSTSPRGGVLGATYVY